MSVSPDCSSSTFTVDNQAAVNSILSECSSVTDFEEVSLSILNYTEKTLVFKSMEENFQLKELVIANSDILQAVNFSAVVDATLDLNNAWAGSLIIANLSALTTLQLGNGDAENGGAAIGGVDYTFQNLPMLWSVLESQFYTSGVNSFANGGVTVFENIGDGSTALFESMELIPKENPTRMPRLNITNALIPNFIGAGINSTGPVTFSNPSSWRPFKISMIELVNAEDMSFANVANLSLPILSNVTGSFEITNSRLQNLDVSGLKTISGNLTLQDLASSPGSALPPPVDFKALEAIGGSLTINNASLHQFSSPITRVNESIFMTGAFSSLDFPSLTHVGGEVKINSTAALDCDSLTFSKIVSERKYSCVSTLNSVSSQQDASSASGTTAILAPTANPSGSTNAHSSGSSSNTAAIAGGVVAGVVATFAVLLGLWIWRRRMARKKATPLLEEEPPLHGRVEMEQQPGPTSAMVESDGTPVAELSANIQPGELYGGREFLPEMDGTETRAELGDIGMAR